ncbi:MAG: MGMT family protein [Clostridia bacterium]|nr:MGMT family protein [Clostridia bacterium]
MEKHNFFNRVYQALKQVPKGKVVTYGQLAYAIGAPRCARQVGFALHVNPEPITIPCHRVVNRFGALAPAFAFGGQDVQAALLKEEGVEVREDYTVDLEKYLYQGDFTLG